MTPGRWLQWDSPIGTRHVHSDAEMALPLQEWKPGAACGECPHMAGERTTTTLFQFQTQVQRKPGGSK